MNSCVSMLSEKFKSATFLKVILLITAASLSACQHKTLKASATEVAPVSIDDKTARKILDTGNDDDGTEAATPSAPIALREQPKIQGEALNEPWMPILQQSDPASTSPVPATTPPVVAEAVPAVPPAPVDNSPKLGIVLGPGGLRTFGEIGFLQEVSKSKTWIQAIVGIEMGSVIAAAYASKAQTFDVEWQLMKLKEDEFFRKGILGGSGPQDMAAMQSFLTGLFGVSKLEDAKVPMACPSLNVQTHQSQMIDKGPVVDALQHCWPYSPFFKDSNGNIAGVTSLASAIPFLKSKGANYLVFVDVLSDRSGPLFPQAQGDENGVWSTILEANEGAKSLFNRVVVLPLGKFPLNDFAHRRDMIQRGQEMGRQLVPDIQKDLGL